MGYNAELLYQTSDNRFVLVSACVGPPWWPSETVEGARLIRKDRARKWLLENNFMLPDCLSQGVRTFPPAPSAREVDAMPDESDSDRNSGGEGVEIMLTPETTADLIDQLIVDAEDWTRPRPGVLLLDGPYPEDRRKEDVRLEQVRQGMEKSGNAIATALVKFGESAAAVLTLLNSVAKKDPNQAKKGWPSVKVSLQETAIRLRLKGEQRPEPPGKSRPSDEAPPPDPEDAQATDSMKATHSPDFTSVNWFGTRYAFAKGNQAETVRLLWEAWEAGEHSLSQETIAERMESSATHFALRKVFRQRVEGKYQPHPAWGTMIRQERKGCYRLVPPDRG